MVKDSRIGESLWQEWTGEGYEPNRPDCLVFFTETHVDLEHEVVRRALASALQRDGSVSSLGHAFAALESAAITHGHAGEIEDSRDFTLCDEQGETREGECVNNVLEITWVEI